MSLCLRLPPRNPIPDTSARDAFVGGSSVSVTMTVGTVPVVVA
jgi:hypothetical protein